MAGLSDFEAFATTQELAKAGIFLFDGPDGAMGIDFFFWRWGLFFARQRENFLLVFFWVFFFVFLLFWGGVFVLFWCFFFRFSCAARIFFLD